MEGSFHSYDPLMYYVNNVERLERDAVKAFLADDQEKMKTLADQGRNDYDVFICVNSSWHGFVLLVPNPEDNGDLPPNMFTEKQLQDPFEVPSLLFCWKCELRFDDASMRTYVIDFKMVQFKDVQRSIKKAYFISKYNAGLKGVQLAAMRAAPHHYNVILNDCVEFSKKLCIQLMAYSTNRREIEKAVNENIKKASATGFSIEQLSRQNKSSGYIGNSLLGGADVSTFLQDRNRLLMIGLGLFLLLAYPLIIAIVVKYYL